MASKQAEELIKEIQERPHVASWRKSVMLTIIALIKQQGVRLPERRVELYNRAADPDGRLGSRPAHVSAQGRSTRFRFTNVRCHVTVWSRVAYWMHAQTNRASFPRSVTTGVNHGVGGRGARVYEARCTAESYLKAAKEVSGSFNPRGEHVRIPAPDVPGYLALLPRHPTNEATTNSSRSGTILDGTR